MRNVDFSVNDGTTGTAKCIVRMSDVTGSSRGVISNSPNVVNSDGNSISLGGGVWLIPGADFNVLTQNILPSYSGGSLGSDTKRLSRLYMGQGGINMQSSNGTKYLLIVTDDGKVAITVG